MIDRASRNAVLVVLLVASLILPPIAARTWDRGILASPIDLAAFRLLSVAEASDLAQVRPTEGVQISGADKWHAAGFRGQGVRVGVIDGGFKGYQKLLGTALPQNVTVKSFANAGIEADTPHGAATAEIVHQMAPDAELFLANYDSFTSWGRAVDWLVSQNVKIISSSMGYTPGPLDGSDNFAVRIDELRKQGILWVNAMGNEAGQHYRAPIAANEDGYHQFGAGKVRMNVGDAKSGRITIGLAWPDKGVDLDLYCTDTQGNIVAKSENRQVSGQWDPEEFVVCNANGKQLQVAVRQKVAGRTPIVFDLTSQRNEFEIAVPEGSITPMASARGAFAVAAIRAKDDVLAPYSSWGPTWDGRAKPEIGAPTEVRNSSYPDRGFNGTSAATPHVSGAAALVLTAFPNYGPDEVQKYLTDAALDFGSIGIGGRNMKYGAGRLRLPDPPRR